MKQKAIVLLSGGIDSSTTLAMAIKQGYHVYTISFNYGQRHRFELDAAKRVSAFFNSNKHIVMGIDLRSIGGSALTSEIDVPKNNSIHTISSADIPVTYVPARNTIFLSLTLAWAEIMQIYNIFIGVNAVDYSGYPDCRPEYIEAFENMANLATKTAVEGNKLKIHTPLINLTKAEIIKQGYELGVDYSLTHSCYDPSENGMACGTCDSCVIRKNGFLEANIKDPTIYKIK